MAELFGSSSKSGEEGEEEEEEEDDSSLESSARSYQPNKRQRTTSQRILSLAERIHCKICHFDGMELPVKAHRSAVNSMVELRDLLLQLASDADRDVRLMLLYAGVSVHRRTLTGSEGDEASDLNVTLALLFMLQVLCDVRARDQTPPPIGGGVSMSPSLQQYPPSEAGGPTEEGVPGPSHPTGATGGESPEAADAPPRPVPMRHEQTTLQQWGKQSLQQVIEQLEKEDPHGQWDEALRLTPDSVCRACVWEAPRLQKQGTLAGVGELASTFFRCSALTLMYNMLEAQKPGREEHSSFLTLSTMNFLQDANETLQRNNLAAIVDSAESEAGQQVLRDMILSFTLPHYVVGVRKVPLLSREANIVATEHFTKLLGDAHETAMRGAEWTWTNDIDEMHKIGALLAGLCILLAGRGGSTDIIRKSEAFKGRVQLPFLETTAPPSGTARMAFVPHRNEWMIYTVDKHGAPQVQM